MGSQHSKDSCGYNLDLIKVNTDGENSNPPSQQNSKDKEAYKISQCGKTRYPGGTPKQRT